MIGLAAVSSSDGFEMTLVGRSTNGSTLGCEIVSLGTIIDRAGV